MKKLLALSIISFAATAAENPLGRLSIQSVIDPSLKSFSSKVSNQFEWDIYCKQLVFRGEIEDPEKYQSLGEKIVVKENVYLRAKAEKHSTTELNFSEKEISEFTEKLSTASIKAVRLDESLSHCEYGTFYTYSFYASKSQSEELSLDLIFKELKNFRPIEIQAKLAEVKRLDFSNTAMTDLKPLQFFYALKKLDLANTRASDLRPLAALPRLEWIDISSTEVKTLKALMNFRDRLRVIAKNHKLANAKELEVFKK
jgi:Leucine-rich repeat (LRR) protein